ncbi:MAG: YitT family protein [Bacteroidetes bacterium]|nr:YitT family protein [Bacteroidota bacterium]
MPKSNSKLSFYKKRIRRINKKMLIRDTFLIASGVGSAALGLKGFLLPNRFLDGGVTGISLLTNRLTGISLSILIVLISTPFILIGIRQVSRTFAIKSTIAILSLATAIASIHIPHITDDKLLIAVFGGFFLGAGSGLAIRGGAVIDGTEVMAIYISRNSFMSVGDVIAVFNVAIFGAAVLLINVETALYSMLTYLAASKTVDFLITGIEEYIGVTIISNRADRIQKTIINNMGRAVTIYKGEGGYGKSGIVEADRKIIFSVVTRLEVQKLVVEVEKIDPNAFIIQHTINDTRGGMIKKRPLH